MSLMKPETDILTQKSESPARQTMKVHVTSSFKTRRRWWNDKQKKNEQEMLLCSSVLTTWPLTYHFTWIQLAEQMFKVRRDLWHNRIDPTPVTNLIYAPSRPQHWAPGLEAGIYMSLFSRMTSCHNWRAGNAVVPPNICSHGKELEYTCSSQGLC